MPTSSDPRKPRLATRVTVLAAASLLFAIATASRYGLAGVDIPDLVWIPAVLLVIGVSYLWDLRYKGGAHLLPEDPRVRRLTFAALLTFALVLGGSLAVDALNK